MKINWIRVGCGVGVGIIVMVLGTFGYDKWRVRNGWCMVSQYDKNGQLLSEETLYGKDCYARAIPD